ncbi:MAG: hypothetical protein ACJ05G_02740 [Actinomycetota bacterium]|nr:hypothetical protein [Acidimicrobiales bacterium]
MSGVSQNVDISFEAISSSTNGNGGVPHGELLSKLSEALWSKNLNELTAVREELINAAGADVFVDAVGVSAMFHMMTRIADGTGTPLDAGTDEPSADIREAIGVNHLVSRRQSAP